MSDSTKFTVKATTLTASAPFDLSEPEADEEAFLKAVDRLMDHRSKSVTLDLVRAGSLSSTVIALVIVASRRAVGKGKSLCLKVAKRNAIAVRVSGLPKLLDVQLV